MKRLHKLLKMQYLVLYSFIKYTTCSAVVQCSSVQQSPGLIQSCSLTFDDDDDDVYLI